MIRHFQKMLLWSIRSNTVRKLFERTCVTLTATASCTHDFNRMPQVNSPISCEWSVVAVVSLNAVRFFVHVQCSLLFFSISFVRMERKWATKPNEMTLYVHLHISRNQGVNGKHIFVALNVRLRVGIETGIYIHQWSLLARSMCASPLETQRQRRRRRNALFYFRLHAKCLWQIDKLLLYYTL